MPEITVTTTQRFDPERFYDMSDFQWASTYLAEGMSKTAGALSEPTTGIRVVTWVDPDDPERGTEVHKVPWQRLGEAIAHLASGTFTTYDGREVEPLPYHVTAAVSIIRGDETEWEWDSETEDLILQQAVFGKVIYG